MLDSTAADGNDNWVLSPEELKAVFASAEHGSTIVYAVGSDLITLEMVEGRYWDKDNNAGTTARYAHNLWRWGEAELVQRKLGPNRYEYLCLKK